MSQDRLTRHEITWLLAQEARGAAKTLRDEVGGLARPGTAADATSVPVVTTLDALDDAIEMLSELNTGRRGTPRRGRIDLAALLYEVAPNARIAIEPGAGTEVLGEEGDLRRMLGVLVSQASTGGAETELRIRRQGDWVKISIELGPDVSASGELERRWLSRMATRHGGRVELEGGTQAVFLQADGASDQREVTALRRELEQAQQLGEAYARELATMLATGELGTEPPPVPQARDATARLDALRGAAAAFERTLRRAVDTAPEASDPAQAARRSHALLDIAAELAPIAECPIDEAASEVDIAAELRALHGGFAAKASRDGIDLSVSLPERLAVTASQGVMRLLLRALFSHALSATPRGGRVVFSAYLTELGVVLAVEDGGPVVPDALRDQVIRHAVDPTSLGRPAGMALLAAHAAASALGAELTLREAARGATETWVTFTPR